jgi:hypothetical protein
MISLKPLYLIRLDPEGTVATAPAHPGELNRRKLTVVDKPRDRIPTESKLTCYFFDAQEHRCLSLSTSSPEGESTRSPDSCYRRTDSEASSPLARRQGDALLYRFQRSMENYAWHTPTRMPHSDSRHALSRDKPWFHRTLPRSAGSPPRPALPRGTSRSSSLFAIAHRSSDPIGRLSPTSSAPRLRALAGYYRKDGRRGA